MAKKKLFVETEEDPCCPHCGKVMEQILVRRDSLAKPVVGMCPSCKKVIPIAYES